MSGTTPQIIDLFEALKAALAKPSPEPANYIVTFGPYLGNRRTFATFAAALGCFREHFGELPERARLVGATYDDEHDGLTAEEREAVEFAEETAITRGEP